MSHLPPPRGPHDTQILHPLPSKPPVSRQRGLLRLVGLLATVAVLGGVLGAAYLQIRLSSVERIDLPGLSRSHDGMTILLVGSDSRKGLEPGQESFGTADQVGGQRSDAIMLLHVGSGGRASVLSIPRDLWVPIAGTGSNGRINSAYGGGPDRLVQTITASLGIPIDHYVEVNFDGFRSVVDAIGGLNLYFAAPARDGLAELDVPVPGCVLLSGAQGLAYVRSRHYETLVDGRWKSDPTGDLGRIQRQQDFMRRMIRKSISRGVRNPAVANRLLAALVDHVSFDRDLGTLDLLRLGWRFRSIGSGVEMVSLPTTGVRRSGAAVLQLDQPEADQAIARFLNPPPPPDDSAPADTTVRVLNGSGRAGEAGATAEALRALGFQVTGTGDAARTAATIIRYREGGAGKAALLQSRLPGPAELRLDQALSDVDLELTTGSDFVGTGGGSVPDAGQPEPAPTQPNCAP